MNAFLSPFVDTLYLDGISVVDSQHYVFHGALTAFLADNFAVGGFKENFSWAKRICCSYMMTVVHTNFLLRT